MRININYKGKDFVKIEKLACTAYNQVEHFFNVDPKEINITVHKSRKSYDNKLNRNSARWEVANASYSGEIDILHPNCMTKESSHTKDDFFPILKHEISHIFLDSISQRHRIPKWLDEGFSSYVAGLNINDEYVYIEENFFEIIGTQKGWDEYSNYDAYKTSQMFVKFLIEKFSIKKIIELISTSEKNYYYDNFNKNFKSIFSVDLKIMEKEFVGSINL